MRSDGSHASRKRPNKRRKLSTASNTTVLTDSNAEALHASTDLRVSECVSAALDGIDSSSFGFSCVSCQRSLNARKTTANEQYILCPRCHLPCCLICARTCNAVPVSVPSTPQLSYSPTPPATPLLQSGPLPGPSVDSNDVTPTKKHATPELIRPELFRNASPSENASSVGKRHRSGEDDEDGTLVEYTAEEENGGTLRHSADIRAGCNRMLCGDCCIENHQSLSTTCFDCYDRSNYDDRDTAHWDTSSAASWSC